MIFNASQLMVNGWRAGEEVEFTYHLGKKPGFHLERIYPGLASFAVSPG